MSPPSTTRTISHPDLIETVRTHHWSIQMSDRRVHRSETKPRIYNKTELLIRKRDSLRTFEDYLELQDLHRLNLIIPNDLAEGGSIGRSIALSQLILTWSRKSQCSHINTFLTDTDRSGLEDFVGRCHGLAAAYFSKSIYPHNKNRNIRTDLLTAAKSRITAMQTSTLHQTSRGRQIEFVFIQGAKREFHNTFYRRTPRHPGEIFERETHGSLIRSPLELNHFLKRCQEYLNIAPDSRRIAQTHSIDQAGFETPYPIATLIHEAFRNTAEHAYLRPDGMSYSKNFRCFLIAVRTVGRESFKTSTISSHNAQSAAQTYFEQSADRYGRIPRETIDFLEISLLDSGPGFSQTIEGQGYSQSSDVESVAACFERHVSSKVSRAGGLGLSRILTAVSDLRGFLRVRTSGSEAFYAKVYGITPDSDPSDFVHGNLPHVEGTVITVGIPVVF